MGEHPVFSVIIPVYNKWELTSSCLRGLAETTPEPVFEVLVVDNGSSDETAAELAPLGHSLFGKRFRRLRLERNCNFGPACNMGARAAKAPLLFFLNNDTLPEAGWAPPLLDALAQEPRPAGVGPLLLYPNTTVQHLGIAFTLGSVLHLYRNFPRTHPFVSRRRRFQAITAAALLLPADLFLECGGFFEEYRNGFEDVDLCLRLGRHTGGSFTCVPESVFTHFESQTPGRKLSESHNTQLLRQRCGHLFRPDKHLLGRDDGLAPFIGDSLEIGLCLPAAEEAALNAALHEYTDVNALREQIDRHPFWAGGRRRMAEVMEQAACPEQAWYFRACVADIVDDLESARLMLRAAARLGKGEAMAVAEEIYRAMCGGRQARARLQGMQGKARSLGDTLLEELCAAKYRELYP